jgi:conjugative relaxase-like TrwC/TraI family protein
MMTASSIPADRGGGYARYLEGKTVAPERGDYYLTPDGEMTQAPGRWLAQPDTLERLGVKPDEPVAGEDFVALMEGRHPGTGRWLRPTGAGGGRGGGIDVTFSAPKSVSVAWALSDPWQRERIEAAHARAVEQAMLYMRERVPLVRRRQNGPVIEEQAKDLIAAEYRHTTARGVSGAQAPDPQLHSHVVITAVVREDEHVVAVASRPVFRSAREVGAFYRSALAEGLAREGYAIKQGTGKDSRYFEIDGVPRGLVDEFSKRSREVAHAAERFRAKYGRAPERGELRNLALENRKAKELTTRADLQRVWQETGRRHDFGADEALRLLTVEPPRPSRTIEDRIEQRLTEHHAIFDPVVLRAVALEQSAGEMTPDMALGVAREMVRDRHVIPLEGGRMTTLAVRAQEQAIERRAKQLAEPAGRDVGEHARTHAAQEVAERISGPLSPEQNHALRVLTGPERATVLIGPAGTGKGVVIDAAARAEQHAGRHTIGIAVSGSTAERLGADSPALAERTLTLDALVARANTGAIDIDRNTTVFLDEAGMVDHKRLDALTELVERSGAKLIAVGDGKQLPSIGPGGMFDRIAEHAPAAELEDVHRTRDPAEQKAWRALRNGEPEKAMAHYVSRGQLYFRDTRDEAGETAVQRWHTLTQKHGLRQVALIADASNMEIDRLNARAQHLRGQNGELGHHEVRLPHVHYGVRQGDLIAFTTQHRPPGQPRVENGTRGQIVAIHDHDSVTITLDGSDRRVRLDPDSLDSIRLAYAQHVYRQQGATVERSVIVTGGWQTSKETAYVEATRARRGTEWYIARDDLGAEGQDARRITRLAQKMINSRAQAPSLAHAELPDPSYGPDPQHTLIPDRARLPGITRTLGRLARSRSPSLERTR